VSGAAVRLPGAARHHGFDEHAPAVLEAAFADAVDALEKGSLPYVLIGGLASAAVGRPRCSADIDLFVHPRDAARALELLAEAGFETEETNPHWLYKATRDGVLVDVIFKGPRDVYLDAEMLARARVESVLGHPVRIAPAEDLLVMKALVHDEETPRHWHDALGIVAAGDLDWDYLVQRARKGNRRVLSLLYYALSVDLAVPARAIAALHRHVEAEGGGDGAR
jgi:predicted nucleotidyltransferase